MTCINDKKINKKYTLNCIIVVLVVLYVRLTRLFFFLYIKHILNLEYTKQ